MVPIDNQVKYSHKQLHMNPEFKGEIDAKDIHLRAIKKSILVGLDEIT
jgi:hypothetical protein